jgi:threonyl-tRNA synthetase
MIHRAIIGSFERFLAILTEHYSGEFPLFLTHTKAIFVPIGEAHLKYVNQIVQELKRLGHRAEVLYSSDSLNKRIRIAEKQRVPFVVVVGDREVAEQKLALRDRRDRTKKIVSKEEFIQMVKKECEVEI